nr:MAG TPA: hypothetical protein [Caudoviricetes sp.]
MLLSIRGVFNEKKYSILLSLIQCNGNVIILR